MRATTSIILGTAVGCALALAFEPDARACGGCFQPPPPPQETETVVTDHRMVLSVTSQQTTLYDQIRFQGNPSEFAWVLPINGEATLGVSADSLFATLDAMTTTTVIAPDTGCPGNPNNCNTALSSSFAAPAESGGAGGVTVIRQEVVGPYQTVQLASSNPTALTDWLSRNGYTVAPDVAPIIAAYVQGHYDFLALKLKPGANVQSMRPVRVTTSGGSPVLPLRMVAAGTGPRVGITLWVVAEGRYEAQNFPNFAIQASDVAWDWAKSTSNFSQVRADKSADGKSWETESSMTFDSGVLANAVRFGYYGGTYAGGGAGVTVQQNDYLPITDAKGNVVTSADEVRDLDLAALVKDIAPLRITRLRADLAHASLASDLVLQPAADPSELSNVRKVTREIGQPQCPIYDSCIQSGTAPRDIAIARTKTTAAAFACAVGDAPGGAAPTTLVALAALAGFLGLALVRARRRA